MLGNWFFIHALGMGFDGSPLATSVSRIFTCGITFLYYYVLMPRWHPHLVQGHSYGGDLRGTEPEDILLPAEEEEGDEGKGNGNRAEDKGKDALREPLLPRQEGGQGGKITFRQAFWRFLALAIPGGVMVGLEAWSFDLTTSLAARSGTEALDAHQSMMSISAFTYLTVPLAVAISATIRVGNLLGAQQPKQVGMPCMWGIGREAARRGSRRSTACLPACLHNLPSMHS